MEMTIYLRMKNRINAAINQTISIGDTAHIIAEPAVRTNIESIKLRNVEKRDNNFIIIDVMTVIAYIQKAYPEADVQTIGPAQTIVEVKTPKKRFPLFGLLFVWLLLFFGSGIAIMNFHEDVSMQSVQQRIYFMITGKKNEYPLLFQIPYSFGLGMGMILFFNHLFKKKFNEEPSPLEVEMFNYQQDLDQYLIIKERKEGEKK